MQDALTEVMTLMEAAVRWDVPASTLRHYAGGYRRPDGTLVEPIFTATETRKSEGTVLITQSAMERVFGAEKNARPHYEQTALFE